MYIVHTTKYGVEPQFFNNEKAAFAYRLKLCVLAAYRGESIYVRFVEQNDLNGLAEMGYRCYE